MIFVLVPPGQARLFDEDEVRRVNVFDWDYDVKGFGELMGRGDSTVVAAWGDWGFGSAGSILPGVDEVYVFLCG